MSTEAPYRKDKTEFLFMTMCYKVRKAWLYVPNHQVLSMLPWASHSAPQRSPFLTCKRGYQFNMVVVRIKWETHAFMYTHTHSYSVKCHQDLNNLTDSSSLIHFCDMNLSMPILASFIAKSYCRGKGQKSFSFSLFSVYVCFPNDTPSRLKIH